jgi:hypothetical protein
MIIVGGGEGRGVELEKQGIDDSQSRQPKVPGAESDLSALKLWVPWESLRDSQGISEPECFS